MNLQISGTHTFNQDINYNIVVNAGQVLMNRFKVFNPKLDPQPDQRNSTGLGSNLLNLYYNISGNIDNFKYSSNKEGVKTAMIESETQRDDIKAQLVKIFGSSIQSAPPPQYQKPEPVAEKDKTNNPLKDLFKPKPDNTKPTVPKKNKKEDEGEYLPGF